MTRQLPKMANANVGRSEINNAPQAQLIDSPNNLPERPRPAIRKPLAVNRAYEDFQPRDFAVPFCKFLTNNPTVFHAVDRVAKQLTNNGYKRLSERGEWDLESGGKYFVTRNGSSLIAFAIGSKYEAGNGFSMIAGHVDAITAKVKPIPGLATKEGYVQLGIAPYAGGMNNTWWDRDLGIAGKVLVRESGKIVTKLVNLDQPIARIPTLAPHFGAISQGPFNKETQMAPIIGLDNSDLSSPDKAYTKEARLGDPGSFAYTQPPLLVKAISDAISVTDYSSLLSWELELFDVQGANLGGLSKELIYGGRIDDKLCSWSAIQALLGSTESADNATSPSTIKLVGLFDNEEIGSLTRQGAHGNFLPGTVSRVVEHFTPSGAKAADTLARTFANSFLVSADVTHAFNPNFASAYLENHSPRPNVGIAISADASGHMTTDATSTALFKRVAEKSKSRLQIFQVRNDTAEGGTVGPMLSSAMGCRAIDAGLVQLSMHSIRAATGADDPGLGVQIFKGFFDFFEEVDAEFT